MASKDSVAINPDAIPAWTQWFNALAYNTVWPITVPKTDLSGKQALITGGNTGIGFETASFLLSMNVSRVTICVRTDHPGEPKPSEVIERLCRMNPGCSRDKVETWEVDCASFESVGKLARRWNETGRELDLLFCNAGSLFNRKVKTKDGIELHREINYLSHFLLTLELLPSLKKAKAPRIVFTSSCFHWLGDPVQWDDLDLDRIPQADWSKGGHIFAYGQSKRFMAMFSRELQERLDSNEDTKHIKTFAVHPGNVSTNIFHQFYAWDNWPGNIIIFISNLLGISAREGARALIVAAVSDEDDRATLGGRYWNRGWEKTPRKEVLDPALRKKLWERSMSDCGMDRSPI